MSWLRGGGSSDNSRDPPAAGAGPPRQGQSPAPATFGGRSGYSSVPQHGSSNSSLPSYGGQQQPAAPALPSRGQRPPPQYNASGAMPGQMEARGAGVGGQFEVVATPVDSLVPRNVSSSLYPPIIRAASRSCSATDVSKQLLAYH